MLRKGVMGYTKEEKREFARRKQTERLTAAVDGLRNEESFRRYLEAKTRFHSYSFNNVMLIMSQKPDATLVTGRRKWKDNFNRYVRAKTPPIWILAPHVAKTDNPRIEPDDDGVRRVTYFRSVKVYDVSDTEPIPGEQEIPLTPPVRPSEIEGNDLYDLIPVLEDMAHSMGLAVDFEDNLADGMMGYFSRKEQRIVLWGQQSSNSVVRTLIHELAHAMGASYSTWGRESAEAIADGTAYLVCSFVGLDVKASAVPYIAAWADFEKDRLIQLAKTMEDYTRKFLDYIPADMQVDPTS